MSQPNEEERNRIVQDVINNIAEKKYIQPPEMTQTQEVIEKGKKIHMLVMTDVRKFVAQVGQDAALDNQAGLRQMIAEKYIAHFRQLDKEELLFLLVVLHVEICFEKI